MIRAGPSPFWRLLALGLAGTLAACTQPVEPETQARQLQPLAKPSPAPNSQAGDAFKHVAQDIQMASSHSQPSQPGETTLVSDALITSRVHHDLRHDSELSGFDIAIETLDGVVTLSGSLPNAASKTRAETLAKLNDGVKFVNNLLDVTVTVTAPAPLQPTAETASAS